MRKLALQLRAVADAHFSLLLVVLALLVLAGSAATVDAYGSDHATTEVRTVASWESVGGFTHHAVVRNETRAFPEGTVLRNRAAYFTRVSPVLNGSFRYSYTASETGNLSVEATLALVIRSTAETDAGEVREYWRVERPVDEHRVDSLAPGERVSIPFSTNVTAVTQRAAAIEDELGGSPGTTEIRLLARVAVNGTRNGEAVDATREYPLEIAFEESVYRVRRPGNGTHSGAQRERITVPVVPSPVQSIGGPLLALVGAAGAAALFMADRRDDLALSDAEREWLTYRNARGEFDEWITPGRPKSGLDGLDHIEIDALEGLVDVAIDSDRRVIEDTERDRYLVRDDSVLYEYHPPDESQYDGERGGGILGPLAPTAERDDERDGVLSTSDVPADDPTSGGSGDE